jgi:signal transduction histidine kinase
VTVATKLRAAFGLYITLLAVLLVYHVKTIRQAVASGHELKEISTRVRVTSNEQAARLGEMTSNAEKFSIRRDTDYVARIRETGSAFELELRKLDMARLSSAERTWLAPLDSHWKNVELGTNALVQQRDAPEPSLRSAVDQFEQTIEQIQVENKQLAAAASEAMENELQRSEQSASSAERLSWISAVSALLLSILLSALLARSIVQPLERLTRGTHEIAAGRFDYRLPAPGRDEFAQVARDFNSMTERLDELDRMKQDFVSKVSHDLKTPLSSMQETISVLLDEIPGPLTGKQRQLLELNRDSGKRLASMLSKLLDLSRIEAGLQPDFQMVDVAQIARQSVLRMNRAREERGLETTVAEPAKRLLVRGDSAGLAQVLDNLLENAIKFSPKGGEVAVTIADLSARDARVAVERWNALKRRGLGDEAVLLTVSDEGPGIPDADKERVFARFFQAEAGRAIPARGVGLGLAICLEIVAAHGGAIWVTNNAPQGSIFNVLLPGAVSMSDESQLATTAGGGTSA